MLASLPAAALAPPFGKQRSQEAPADSSSNNSNTVPFPSAENTSSIPLTAFESLPTIFGRNNDITLVNIDIGSFLQRDLDLLRLNRIHDYLWMAGRPFRAWPLHRYKMMSYQILSTEQMDLHLLTLSNRLLVKPLPAYYTDYDFWQTYLCEDIELHKSACGFLLSYVWLIVNPLDLQIAQELFLIPTSVTWPWWKEFVISFYEHIDVNALDQVNKRYHFGVLRLGRINWIFRIRFFLTHSVHGYLYGHTRSVEFFERNFTWILIAFVLYPTSSLILSAMQVGVGISSLQESKAFLDASYGFVVFNLVSVVSMVGVVGIVYVLILLSGMGAASAKNTIAREQRSRLAKERIGRNNSV